MPVEIRELVIRAVVEPRDPATHASPPGTTTGTDTPSPEPRPDPSLLVQECVRQVMRILAAQKER